MLWKVITSGKESAVTNMRRDYKRLLSLSSTDNPILHFYEWEGDCATYGYFLKPEKYFHEEGVKKKKLSLAKRPTGGGVLFHSFGLAFSVIVPAAHPHFSLNTLDNYAYVNRAVVRAIQKFTGGRTADLLSHEKGGGYNNFCMAKPTKYDVMIKGKKVAGAAQRRTRQGYLHQGSIALTMPPKDYLGDLLQNAEPITEAMCQNTYPLLGESTIIPKQLDEAKRELQQLLKEAVTFENRAQDGF